MSTIAVLGTGVMGAAVLRHLSETGEEVIAYNRTAAKLERLDLGIAVAPTPADAVRSADAVVAFVTDDAASRSVWCGPTGALSTLRPGAVAIECSTLSPRWLGAWTRLVESVGGLPVAAPVTGSRPAAEDGNLICFVGGTPAAVAAASGVLAGFCAELIPFPEPADAGAMKLANNVVGAATLLGLAEALVFAEDQGLDAGEVVEVLSRFGWGSKVAESKGRAMVAEDYADVACDVALLAKDLGYARSGTRTPGRALPVAAAVEGQLRLAAGSAAGQDMAAVKTHAYRDGSDRGGSSIDWFAAARFTPPAAAVAVSNQIDRILADAVQLLRGVDADGTNLYLSGSLARREPAVTWTDGQYSLSSDIDLVAVTRLDDDLHPALRDIAAALAHRHPGTEVSVFVVSAEDLVDVRSMFGGDLVAGLGSPVHEVFEPSSPAEIAIGRRARIENLVHQVGALVVYGEAGPADPGGLHLRRSRYYHRLKTMLEALRCAAAPPAGPARYGDALDRAPDGVEGDLVATLVRDREIFLDQRGETGDDTLGLVTWSTGVILDAGVGATASDVLSRISTAFAGRTDLMNSFQRAVLTIGVLREAGGDVCQEASDGLAETWSSMDRALVVDAGGALDRLCRTSVAASLLGPPAARAAVVGDLREVRLDYYRHLGPHNFGRSRAEGYGEL